MKETKRTRETVNQIRKERKKERKKERRRTKNKRGCYSRKIQRWMPWIKKKNKQTNKISNSNQWEKNYPE